MDFEYTEIVRLQQHCTTSFYEALSLLPLEEQEGRTGVYSSLGTKTGLVLFTFMVAGPAIIKAPKYHYHAGEKVFRLGEHPEHLTSAESANEELEKYGGSFRTAPYDNPKSWIFSTSGLPYGDLDTAAGLLSLWRAKEINYDWVEIISRNNQYREFLLSRTSS